MTLREVVDRYVAWQRDHGAKFHSSAETLDTFCRRIGEDRDCDRVGEEEIRRFLAGNGTLTRTRAVKYGTLAGFYSFALSRGHVRCIPMPPRETEPRSPEVAPPFIFTHEELRRLFRAAGGGRKRCLKLDVETFRTFLLLLYGAGLRSGEARRLTVADVDLDSAVLAVNDTKFYKSRLVPVGADLAGVLRRYAAIRKQRPLPEGSTSAFLACRDGSLLKKAIVRHAFHATLRAAGIDKSKPGCRAACLHSLRHSFATHRLTSWYRERADVQRFLLALSTYLGHGSVAATQVYISMTPDLLDEASRRFERYVENNLSPDAGQHRKGGTGHA
ncbi:MAG: tyrosine-type recombinase/integrase [Alphaproteobacteria bacterium]|nr:tyrosine-type recombinase/integrase [Alphaproteobacteria bacterium]